MKKKKQFDEFEETINAGVKLFELENRLREFVNVKIKNNKGKIDQSFLRRWRNSQKKENTPPRRPKEYDLIYFSNFDELKKIIIQDENWTKIFRKYFGRQDGIISRFYELDSIRNTIAHNRLLSEFDCRSFNILFEQIIGCLFEDRKSISLKHYKPKILLDEKKQKDHLLPNLDDITDLKISNSFLNSLYKKAKKEAKNHFYDAELSRLSFYVTPYLKYTGSVTITLEFYGKFADKMCMFQYYSRYHELSHIAPNKPAKYPNERRIFKKMPWKKSPDWLKFLKRVYSKIGPLSINPRSAYSLSAYPDYWTAFFEDGVSGNEYTYQWEGNSLDEKSIINCDVE